MNEGDVWCRAEHWRPRSSDVADDTIAVQTVSLYLASLLHRQFLLVDFHQAAPRNGEDCCFEERTEHGCLLTDATIH